MSEQIQLNVRVDGALAAKFETIVRMKRTSKGALIEHMIAAYCDSITLGQVAHIDGTPCPLSALVKELARQTDVMFQEIQSARASGHFKSPSTPVTQA